MTATVDYTGRVAMATLPEFGETTDFYAAEIADCKGTIFAFCLEPEARRDGWDGDRERDFRDAVRAWAEEEVGPDSEYNGELPVYLTWDPYRDATEEEILYE